MLTPEYIHVGYLKKSTIQKSKKHIRFYHCYNTYIFITKFSYIATLIFAKIYAESRHHGGGGCMETTQNISNLFLHVHCIHS